MRTNLPRGQDLHPTDECGNQSTSTQKVDVVDDTAPVVLSGWNGCEDPASCAIDINGLEEGHSLGIP